MIFRRKRRRKRAATDTLIGKGSKVEGRIICQTSLRIEGQVQGDVECDGDVLLGKGAVARSTIKARNVYNSGTIHGAIHSEGTLSIANTGQMFGDIKVASLTIATGGIFEGISKMHETFSAPATGQASSERLVASDVKGKLHKLENIASNSPSSGAKSVSTKAEAK